MAERTVVIVDKNGRLVTAKGGVQSESDVRYAKFSKRLLGTKTVGSKNVSVLNFGWDDQGKLVVEANGERGEQIELNAASVVIPESLTVGGKTIQELIDESLGLSISETGFRGANGEIVVTVSKVNPGSAVQPKQVCTIGLSQQFLDRITQIENEIAGRLPSNISFGDGLITYVVDEFTRDAGDGSSDSDSSSSGSDPEPEVRKVLEVKIGTGLSWEGVATPRAIRVDTTDTPDAESELPISSKGVYDALLDRPGTFKDGLAVTEDATTGEKTVSARIGSGLRFSGTPGSENRSIEVDSTDTVESGNGLPVTSDAVYRAIQGGAGGLSLALDANGNINVISND